MYAKISFSLQILSHVLDMLPFSLSIKLAALASRKELVDLEKWLSTYINTYTDTFFAVNDMFRYCLQYLYIHYSRYKDLI